jgi:hypothetical protein
MYLHQDSYLFLVLKNPPHITTEFLHSQDIFCLLNETEILQSMHSQKRPFI